MRGIRVAKVAGFEISLDYSWFIIFFLILWTFTTVVFPHQYPGLERGAYVAMGVVGTLLFFASLLFHELSHSVVARMKGVPVEGITLFVFGGMARTRSEARSPADEFQIAGVGPLASLVVAAAFWIVGELTRARGGSEAVFGVSSYLAVLNLALAIFNLLPGFPLDGGRLFRAAVWRATNDLRKATRIATTGGRWIGYGIIAIGLAQLFFGGLIGGLWFIFIGWFLSGAADASYHQLLLQQVLEGIAAREAMTREPEMVRPDLTLDELVHEYFMRRRYSAFPVSDGDRLLGLIALSQVKEVPREQWPHRRVADVMTPLSKMVVVAPDASMSSVLERMRDSETRRVIVAQDGILLGIISAGDIADWLERARLLE
ncbi:MAG: site-2 protease family protein [Gemmatimonadetes bacterium]|nr:site-2 protease family protein [Gemmatimonadota bacterium]